MKRLFVFLCVAILIVSAIAPVFASSNNKKTILQKVKDTITEAVDKWAGYTYKCPTCGAKAKKICYKWDEDNVRMPGGGYRVQKSRNVKYVCIKNHVTWDFETN